MGVAGKVVAVTGVSSGIGRTVAEVFAERGCHVVGGARREDKGRRVEEAVRERGGDGDFTFVHVDVSERSDCVRFIDATVNRHGRIDVLINNAGGGGRIQATEHLPEDEFDATLRLNLHSALFCSQRAVQHMKQAGNGGVILNIASVQGVLAVTHSASYNTAKAALIQLTRTLAVEYLTDGIRANVIVMGGAPTAAAAAAMRGISALLKGPNVAPDLSPYLPPPISGTPLRDVATALVSLADEDARAITGATIALDQAQTAGSLYSEAVLHALSGAWTPPEETPA